MHSKKTWMPAVVIHMHGAAVPIVYDMPLTTKKDALFTAQFFRDGVHDDLRSRLGHSYFKLSTKAIAASTLR